MLKLITTVLMVALGLPVMAAVELNSATRSELESLKGIGPAKAEAIIAYRTQHGPFKRLEDLDKVRGFGPASIERLRGHVMVRHLEFRPLKPSKP